MAHCGALPRAPLLTRFQRKAPEFLLFGSVVSFLPLPLRRISWKCSRFKNGFSFFELSFPRGKKYPHWTVPQGDILCNSIYFYLLLLNNSFLVDKMILCYSKINLKRTPTFYVPLSPAWSFIFDDKSFISWQNPGHAKWDAQFASKRRRTPHTSNARVQLRRLQRGSDQHAILPHKGFFEICYTHGFYFIII